MFYVLRVSRTALSPITDDTEVFYFVDEFYAPQCERGIRWNDPTFSIDWPTTPTVLSDKDQNHLDFSAATHCSDRRISDK